MFFLVLILLSVKQSNSLVTIGTCLSHNSAIDLRWVKRWKTELELCVRLVARGCFQDDEKLDTDTLFASAPSWSLYIDAAFHCS